MTKQIGHPMFQYSLVQQIWQIKHSFQVLLMLK